MLADNLEELTRVAKTVRATFIILEVDHRGIVHNRIDIYKLVLAHVEEQGEGLDRLNIAAASMGDADREGGETREVLFPLVQASKWWRVGHLSMFNNRADPIVYRDNWTALARHSEMGNIGVVFINTNRELRDARPEDVKKLWDISENFVDIDRAPLFLVGGGQGKDPEADWKRLVEYAGFES